MVTHSFSSSTNKKNGILRDLLSVDMNIWHLRYPAASMSQNLLRVSGPFDSNTQPGEILLAECFFLACLI